MFKRKPVLKYECPEDIYPNLISPAQKHIPEWYRKMPRWEPKFMFQNMLQDSSIKLCMPFLESLMCGYMITLPYDLYVKNNNGDPYLTWRDGTKHPPRWRESVSNDGLVPYGHYPREYIWDCSVSYTLPKGYSALFTHPLNRYDLPFTTISAVIDGGLVMAPHGNAPFYIKNGFEGMIEKGTPIAQIIPFKHEDWTSKSVDGLAQEGYRHSGMATTVFQGWYKNTFWKRKKYQ